MRVEHFVGRPVLQGGMQALVVVESQVVLQGTVQTLRRDVFEVFGQGEVALLSHGAMEAFDAAVLPWAMGGIAALASVSLSISTKPKPLRAPETLSVAIRQDSTAPCALIAPLSSVSVVAAAKLPA